MNYKKNMPNIDNRLSKYVERGVLDGAFEEIGIKDQEHPYLYLRLDIMLARIVCNIGNIPNGIDQLWSEYFSDIEGSYSIFDFTQRFYSVHRISAIDLLEVDILSNTYKYMGSIRRFALRYLFISLLDEKTFTKESIIDKMIYLAQKDDISNNLQMIKDETLVSLHNYFGDKEVYKLDENGYDIIKTNKEYVIDLYNKIVSLLRQKYGEKSETKQLINERKKLDGAFEPIGIWEKEYPMFFLRIDILLAFIMCSGDSIKNGIAKYWKVCFPDITGTPRIFEFTREFYWTRRTTVFDIVENDVMNSDYKYIKNIQRFAVRYLLLLTIDNKPFTTEGMTETLYGLIRGVSNDIVLVKEETEINLHNYFGDEKVYQIDGQTIKLIDRYRDIVNDAYYKICDIVKSKNSGERQNNQFSSNYNIGKIETLLEICYLDLCNSGKDNQNNTSLEALVEKHWDELYKNINFNMQNWVLVRKVIEEDDFLYALKTLIVARQVKEIRNIRLTRLLAYGYTMKYVLLQLGSNCEYDSVVDETIEFATHINFIGVGEDEEIALVKQLANRYCTEGGSIDEDIIAFFANRNDNIKSMYHIIKSSFNSRYASKSIADKDRIINELQERVEYEDKKTLGKVIQRLTDKDLGSVLNELYLISRADGIIDSEEVRTYLLGLFYIFDSLGIRPTYADKIGQTFLKSDRFLQRCEIKGVENNNSSSFILKYPGWEVEDEEIVLPICIPTANNGGDY